jgi:hypothetical protein
MDKFKNHIDRLVSKVLNEEIESKIKQITETMSGEWTEIEMEEELKGNQKKLDVAKPKGKLTGADFKKLRTSKETKVTKKFGGKYGMEEQETEEGNAFSGALADAKKSGKDSFEVDGKKYSVKENKGSLKLTENELIDMIEKIVMEQKVKDIAEKENIAKKSPQGLKDTDRVLTQNKKVNDDHTKEVVKKMKEYLKDMTKADYNENPEDFPRSNYDIDKDEKVMKYNPSEAVEEYIEAFDYPGMTNLVYDEIKPDDKKIDKYLKGDSTTGNAVTDKDGKALGNVGKSKVGDRFKKNYDQNLYGAEQMNASYKRVSQPVDVAGDETESGSLSSKKGGKQSSINKASDILNKLESKEDKKSQVVSEEMNKMKNLIGYNRKTQ